MKKRFSRNGNFFPSIHVCVCCQPPSRPVCLNHKLVEFQPWILTGPYLVSVANSYTIFLSPRPTCSNNVMYHPPPPPGPIYYLPPPHISPVDTTSLYFSTLKSHF